MKIVTRYLAREVYLSMLAAIMVLLLIFLSNQTVRFMHSAAYGTLAGSAVKIIILLQLPILAATLLPASLYLGILFAYGRLYADSEMVILHACGVNPRRLLTTTLTFSAVIMALVAVLSLEINPRIYRYFDHLMSGTTNDPLMMIKANHFNELDGGRWIFYANKISSDHRKFFGIFAAQQPTTHQPVNTVSPQSSCVVMAQQAYLKFEPATGNRYLVLVNGHRYIGTPGKKDYEVTQYHEYGIRINHETPQWHGDESTLPTHKLWSNRTQPKAAAELHWRISLPLSALILTLIGTPLSYINPRRGRYAKFAPAILLYITYANFLFLAKAWLKKGVITPALGMWWVHGLMLIIAIVLIGRQSNWKSCFNWIRYRSSERS